MSQEGFPHVDVTYGCVSVRYFGMSHEFCLFVFIIKSGGDRYPVCP